MKPLGEDELIKDHAYRGPQPHGKCTYITGIKSVHSTGADNYAECGYPSMMHADPGGNAHHLVYTQPHTFEPAGMEDRCTFTWPKAEWGQPEPALVQVCGYPEALHHDADRTRKSGALVRMADKAQYARQPMPDEARKGPVVSLIDAPVDPLGTLAVISGIYVGQVARSKAEVTDEQRRAALADMQATVLDGPLEAIQFTFLIEGVDRAFTHQAVRNRFSFFGQESLRFAVADDWAEEVPLPPSIPQGSPAEGVWRKALNNAEDAYNALIGVGMPAEEARGVLPHAITTRYYWTVSLRTLLQEAGKRTCTQAQFAWRIVMAGVAKALRERESQGGEWDFDAIEYRGGDGWQYQEFADLIRPVCYQQGKCGFMAKFDRGCTIRERVDALAEAGVPSKDWGSDNLMHPSLRIDPSEWAADPAAARVTDNERPATDKEVKDWLG